jgi:hypothetical protein
VKWSTTKPALRRDRRGLATLPELTVVNGATVDRRAIVRGIEALRASDGEGKVVL